MVHHLTADIGWPLLMFCAVLAALAVPTLVKYVAAWIRFEIQLSRRVRRYEEREEAARVARVRW